MQGCGWAEYTLILQNIDQFYRRAALIANDLDMPCIHFYPRDSRIGFYQSITLLVQRENIVAFCATPLLLMSTSAPLVSIDLQIVGDLLGQYPRLADEA